jgi:hypothetical protein
VLGVLLFLTSTALGQQSSKYPPAKKPAPGSLEDLLSQALKNNPDIHVAEAKLREAEAELNRTRVLVAGKIVALQASIRAAEKARDEAEARFVASMKIREKVGIRDGSDEEIRGLKLAWERSKYEVLKLQAEMPALIGKLPDGVKKEQVGGFDLHSLEQYAVHIRWAQKLMAEEAALAKSPKGTLADKIRKALDKPIDANYKDKSLTDVLKEIQKHFDGIPVRVTQGAIPQGKMDLDLGKVTLGAAIQAFNDLAPESRFVVREYGILFTHKDFLPPNAVLLHDFWKSEMGKEKPKKDDKQASNPPPEDIEGLVKNVDSTSGLVTITIGSDAGLAKGHTLEVFKLKPEAKYIGRIRIIDVKEKEAVGRFLTKPLTPVQVGDTVASKVK